MVYLLSIMRHSAANVVQSCYSPWKHALLSVVKNSANDSIRLLWAFVPYCVNERELWSKQEARRDDVTAST